jgi:hypothetical protein
VAESRVDGLLGGARGVQILRTAEIPIRDWDDSECEAVYPDIATLAPRHDSALFGELPCLTRLHIST